MGAGHDHSHAPGTGAHLSSTRLSAALRRRLSIALVLASGLVIAQLIGSVLTGSLALLTDTAHAVADASGLAVALVAATLMARPATPGRTWGFRRLEVLAALGQGVLLLVVGTYTVVEAVRRLGTPPEVASTELLVFGVVGFALNAAAVGLLASSREANMNMRAAFLEVLNDALGSLAVIVAAVVIATTGFDRADALAALFIAALILPRAWRLVRDTGRVLLEFAPANADLTEISSHLAELPGVVDVHDLHASLIGTGLPVFTAHVVVEDECFSTGRATELLGLVRECVRDHFPVAFDHVTVQMETREGAAQCSALECQPH